MRPTTRLLAQASRYLEAGNPTGLTGLLTHASPRSTLMYTYNSMLDKLKKFPEHSVYRQSVEALTKQRLSVIESIKPEGLEEWQQRVTETVKAHPEAFRIVGTQTNAKEVNFVWKESALAGVQSDEFDDEPPSKPELEGPRTIKERSAQRNTFERDIRLENAKFPRIEPEPPLSAEQISSLEQQLSAGLIEEVIQVAEGESRLIDTLYENKVWEDLEEKPVEGQWTYFERGTHTPTTQAR